MEFRYKARSRDGNVVEGIIQGASLDAAVASVRERGLVPITLESRSASALTTKRKGGLLDTLRTIGTVPLREKVIFFRQLGTMVRAGVTLGDSLAILTEQT
ncbi:MAG TPA: type II secretion system F family protein, partial [Synergistaceae bacterium]|nr:type II secretion system F family protein [Synergistaceae bacterium]